MNYTLERLLEEFEEACIEGGLDDDYAKSVIRRAYRVGYDNGIMDLHDRVLKAGGR